MTSATKQRDRAHARMYALWFSLPAWRAMRNDSHLLLMYMLAEYRPQTNEHLEWPLSKVQRTLRCGRQTASECLVELEDNGWIVVVDVGQFSGASRSARYRLRMQPSFVEGLQRSNAFMNVQASPRPGRKNRQSGSNKTPPKFQQEPIQVLNETAAVAETSGSEGHGENGIANENKWTQVLSQPDRSAHERRAAQLLYGTALGALERPADPSSINGSVLLLRARSNRRQGPMSS
jgi:hypothetical protein